MAIIYINGKYLSQRTTGVQRYAREVVNIFSREEQYQKYQFVVVCPKNADMPKDDANVRYIKLNKKGYFFEQISLPKYLKKHKAKILLNLCNLAPIFFPGACVIHDMNIVDNKDFYSFAYRLIVKFITRKNIKKYKPIFTVSAFSKDRIQSYFNLKKQIIITYAGIKDSVECSCDYSQKFLFSTGKYFFTVGSMNKTKNTAYIIEAARKRPNDLFVIAGGEAKVFQKNNIEAPANVLFLGYVQEMELQYLYQHCSAFILPSIYEGFGIPPLEAFLYGCNRVILSEIAVFKEIYSDYVSYCNPYKVETLLPLLDSSKEVTPEERQELLSKYTWSKTANKIFEGIKEQL